MFTARFPPVKIMLVCVGLYLLTVLGRWASRGELYVDEAFYAWVILGLVIVGVRAGWRKLRGRQ